MATLANDNVSFSRLGAIIENDTVLAGIILRVVNSPLYGHRATINSVAHALSILGLPKTRNLVLGLGITKRWATAKVPKSWSTRQFNLHSLACGVMADQIALANPVPYPEGAFAAGLLHDIGHLLMAVSVPQETDELFALAHMNGKPFDELETEFLGISHVELSAWILEKWNLPAPIRKAVADHHLPMSRIGNKTLSYVVAVADQAVEALGYSITMTPNPAPNIDTLLPPTVAESFESEFEALRSVI
jgi:HD-like signal output (HDOD) protein